MYASETALAKTSCLILKVFHFYNESERFARNTRWVFKMKTKLLAMTAVSVIVLTVSLLWLMDGKVQDERKQSLETGLRGPVNALSQTLLADLRGLRRALPVAGTSSKDRIDWDAFKPFSAIGQIRRTDSKVQVLHFANNGLWPASEWTADTAARWLAETKAPAADVASMTIVKNAEGKKILAVTVPDGDNEWIAFTGPEYLEALLDLQKGPKGWLAILNSQGQILAHSTGEYVGTQASAGSVLDQVRKNASTQAMETFEHTDSEPVTAAFEKPARTDLVVVGARAVGEMRADRRKTLTFGTLAGLGILLLVTSTLWTSLTRWERTAAAEASARAAVRAKLDAAKAPAKAEPVAKKEPKVETEYGGVTKMESAPKAAEAPASAVMMVPQPTAKERKDTFARIASALAYEMRSPLLAILGHGQTVLASTEDKRLTEPVESILRETRGVREVVDKLLAYSGDLPAEKKDGRLETVVAKVLKEFEPKFQQRHVKLAKDLRETTALPMVSDALEKALRHVLTNALDATERMGKKEISIRMSEDTQGVRLEIKDNGEGMTKENLSRAMDPFFTTRNPTQHLGMGLPAAFGVLREHNGELRMESELGKGTTVTFVLPKKLKTIEIGGAPVVLKTEEVVAIPAELPHAEPEAVPKTASPADVDLDRLLPADLSSLALDEAPAAEEREVSEDDEGGSKDAEVVVEEAERELLDIPGAEEMAMTPLESQDSIPLDDEKTPALPVDASMPAMVNDEKTPALSMDEIIANPIEAAPQGPAMKNGIQMPKFTAPNKNSKLDSVRVEIRRPGPRA